MAGSPLPPASTAAPRPAGGWRWLGWAAAAVALAAVFAAYLQPAMALQLALQIWSCF